MDGMNIVDDGPVDLEFDADAAVTSVTEEEEHAETQGQSAEGVDVDKTHNNQKEGEIVKEVEYEDICIVSADGRF